jgi:hypothetical protein
MKLHRLLDAVTNAVGVTVLAGLAAAGYGMVTGDHNQVIPAMSFSFVTAIGTAARYDRKLAFTATPI